MHEMEEISLSQWTNDKNFSLGVYSLKNQEVIDVFNRTFNDFQQIGQEIDLAIPPTLSIKGKITSHPSHNVILGGAPKTKRLYRCSKYHEFSFDIFGRSDHSGRNC